MHCFPNVTLLYPIEIVKKGDHFFLKPAPNIVNNDRGQLFVTANGFIRWRMRNNCFSLHAEGDNVTSEGTICETTAWLIEI